jgi:predicted nuclease of predicted toxin-antitoxin system
MRVLFDQGTPVPLAQFLPGHTISTAAREGWSRYRNSDLLNAAEAAGFDVLITTDKNLRYQQNLTGRKIAINRVAKATVARAAQTCAPGRCAAINAATHGAYIEVEIP